MQPAEVEGLKIESRLPIASINHKASFCIGGPATASENIIEPFTGPVNGKLPGGLHQQNWLKGSYYYSTPRYRVGQVFLALTIFTSVIST
jgi:hypothetical protein